jgi:hypothetical protein
MRTPLILPLVVFAICWSLPAFACSVNKLDLDWCGAAAPPPKPAPFVYVPPPIEPRPKPSVIGPVTATDSRGKQHTGIGVTVTH